MNKLNAKEIKIVIEKLERIKSTSIHTIHIDVYVCDNGIKVNLNFETFQPQSNAFKARSGYG